MYHRKAAETNRYFNSASRDVTGNVWGIWKILKGGVDGKPF